MFSTLSARRLRTTLVVLPLAIACSNGNDDDDDSLPPPSLSFLGAVTSDGTSVDADEDSIELGCDGRLTVRVGPRDDVGELVNFRVRPPKYCGVSDPCGYLFVRALDDDGGEVLATTASLLDVLLDFGPDYAGAVSSLEIQLFSSHTLEPYEAKGKPVRATWRLAVTAASGCGGGSGGAGGGSSLGGAPG